MFWLFKVESSRDALLETSENQHFILDRIILLMVAALPMSHTGNVSHDPLPFLIKEYDSVSYEGLA